MSDINVKKVIEDLQKAHADLIEEVKANIPKQVDALTKDKIDRINATISELQATVEKQVDDANQRIEAMLLNLGKKDDPNAPKDPEMTAAFESYMKAGDVSAALNKAVPGEGGYLAPVEWDRTVTKKLVQVSPMRQLCRKITISTAGFTKLYSLGGTASGWVGETTARGATATGTFASLAFVPGEIYANPAATQGMLDDAEINLENWLADEVDTEFAKQEGSAFISGDGTNKPNGLLTYVTGGANAATHPLGAVALVSSGAAATVTTDGFINLVHALPTERRMGAAFLMNLATVEAARLLMDGDDRPLWQPSLQEGQPARLLGYPVREDAYMPAVGADALAIAFGNLNEAYLIVDRTGLRLLRDPFTNKPYVQFYTTKRVGGGLLNPEYVKVQKIETGS